MVEILGALKDQIRELFFLNLAHQRTVHTPWMCVLQAYTKISKVIALLRKLPRDAGGQKNNVIKAEPKNEG